MVNKCIKFYFEWDKAKIAPIRHYILTKMLCNTSLYTFIGMVGYCIKDKGKDHFNYVHRNVTSKQITKGIEEYVKYDIPFATNKIIFTHKNLIERVATFCRYEMKKQLGSTFLGYFLLML